MRLDIFEAKTLYNQILIKGFGELVIREYNQMVVQVFVNLRPHMASGLFSL